ncbi:pro-epidermal growth factor precursor [Xenopus tropicalis]|uniref:LOC100127663 protein n=1 Tax=Xenopus tropicalis TaxID=8364 RepID=A8KBG4_XENTR|eukprot:NP_001106478.1 pro-epidermal growth factor precursor [Xenopus tropicalis]
MFFLLTALWPLVFDVLLLHTQGNKQWHCTGNPLPLDNERYACNTPVPFLIFSHGNDIFTINSDGTNLRKVVPSAGSTLQIDFIQQENRLYWLDQNRGFLQRMYLNGSKHERLRAVGKGSIGFAIDWKHNVIFWANQQKGTIELTSRNEKRSRVLLRGLFNPKFVAIDPLEGLLFWSSNKSWTIIQKATLDGSNVTSIIELSGALKGLTLDTDDKKIFWILSKIDREDSVIGSCSYNGDSVMIVKNLRLSTKYHVLGVSLLYNHIYYSERKSGSIKVINKFTGKDIVSVNLKPSIMEIRNIKVVYPVRSYSIPNSSSNQGAKSCSISNKHCTKTCEIDAENQKCHCMNGFVLSSNGRYCEDINECALWNHGCTLGCENIPGSYFCTCPEGYVLLPDNKTCHDKTPCLTEHIECSHGCVQTTKGPLCTCPEGSVLSEDGKSCTGCTSPDNGGCSHICIMSGPGTWECDCFPGYNLQLDRKQCLASGPRPYLMFANVHDIRRINFDGTNYESVLDSQIGRVFALDYDPVEDRMYFAHTALKCIESANMDGSDRKKMISGDLSTLEGLTVDAINRKLYWTDRGKSCIERSDLNGKYRKILIQENNIQPRGICVHPLAKKLFWTHVGANPRIESSDLEGSEREVIISKDLIWPSGITVDHLTDVIYWCDAKKSVIESANLDGSNRQSFSQNDVGHPFAISVFEDHLWVSDWVQPSLIRIEKRNTQNWVRLRGNMQRPSSVVIVHPLAKPVIADDIPLPRKEKDSNNQTAHSESFFPGPLSTSNAEMGTREAPSSRNGLLAEIMVSDDSGCIDIHCDINAHCVSSEDGPKCQCLEGFTGNGRLCHDIDECSLHIAACNPHQTECIDTEGGYICKCKYGYIGNGLQCTDIDECSRGTHTCGENAVCTNTEGNYTCTCTNGFPGSAADCTGKTIIRECPLAYDGYCLNGGVCIHFPELKDYGCRCVAGYVGERCQFDDLKSWEKHVTQMKIHNVTIAVSLLLLLLILGLGSFAIYYYRHQMTHRKNHFKQETAPGTTEKPICSTSGLSRSSEPGCLGKL